MSNTAEQKQRLIILLTGERAGTGASRLKYGLVADEKLEHLQLRDIPSAGYYRRVLAYIWHEIKLTKTQNELLQVTWNRFSQKFESAIAHTGDGSINVEKTAGTLEAYIFTVLRDHLTEITSTDMYLIDFNKEQALYGKSELFWDTIPDILSYALLTGLISIEGIDITTNIVYEGKLAIYIDRLLGALEELPGQAITIIRFLTKVDEKTSAFRVIRRAIEDGKVTYANVESETLLQWWDKEIYTIPNCDIHDLLAWQIKLINETIDKNAVRMNRDQIAYEASYKKPQGIFNPELMAKEVGAIFIDAAPSFEKVENDIRRHILAVLTGETE